MRLTIHKHRQRLLVDVLVQHPLDQVVVPHRLLGCIFEVVQARDVCIHPHLKHLVGRVRLLVSFWLSRRCVEEMAFEVQRLRPFCRHLIEFGKQLSAHQILVKVKGADDVLDLVH